MMFTMYMFLNFASIISFRLITMDKKTNQCELSSSSLKLLIVVIIFTVPMFASLLFIGTNGVKCTYNETSKGLWLMSAFLILWTIFVIFAMRSHKVLSIKTENIKEVLKFTKEMALDNKKKTEFDAEKMQDAQKKMFILL